SADQLQCVCKAGLCGAGMLDARAAVLAAAGVQARVTVSPSAAVAGQPVTFSSSSLIPAGVTATYKWAVTSDPSAIVPSLSGATGSTLSVTPTGAGTFSISLTTTDSNSVVSSEAVTVVVAAAPSTTPLGTSGGSGSSGGGGGGGALGIGWLLLLLGAVVALRVVPGARARG
ncbi:MAG TPA: PKD domain-containing protein, partial [Caldimonas sp.]